MAEGGLFNSLWPSSAETGNQITGGQITVFLIAATFFACLAFVVWYLYKRLFVYNLKVEVQERIGGIESANPETVPLFLRYDTACIRKTAEGVEELHLWKANKTLPRVDFKYVYPCTGLFHKRELKLFKDGMGNYHQVRVSAAASGSLAEQPDSQDVTFWDMQKTAYINQEFNKQSFWQQYGQILMPVGIICVVAVFGIIIVNKIDAGIEQLGHFIDILGQLVGELKGLR